MPRPEAESDRRCANCYFWEPHRDSIAGPAVGQCRYSPPIYEDGDGFGLEPVSSFPQTYETDWCGDYAKGEQWTSSS